jgi:hypothetical protein
MAITTMCSATEPGATLDTYWSKPNAPIYTKTTHKGLVLQTYERNGYDDSDFYAVVWNEDKGCCEHICYASTRGWSYPNGASVDATPEVVAKADALAAKAKAEAAEKRAAREAITPTKGKTVRVITKSRGKDAPEVGESGTVFYFAKDRFDRSGRYYNDTQRYLVDALGLRDPRKGMRVGFKNAEGKARFVNAMMVEVVND